jgi:hypothetical protein
MVPSVVNPPQSNRDQAQHAYNQAQVSQVSLSSFSQNMNRRQSGIGAYVSGKRKEFQISSMHPKPISAIVNTCRAKLDSHADTCGVNDVALILEHLGKVAEVHGFSKSLQAMQDIPIVKAAVAYDDSNTGETYILILN